MRNRCFAALGLLLSALCLPCAAQVVTPRGRDAAVYHGPDVESQIVAQVEADGRWRIEFGAAQVPVRLPGEQPAVEIRLLLPARDTGTAVLMQVRGPGRGNEGWVEPGKVDISPAPFWRLPSDTPLYVPLTARQAPPLRQAPLPAALRLKPCSYLLLVDPEGKVAGSRPLSESTNSELEAALPRFRFTPVRVDGEPVHLLLALRFSPR